MLRITSKLSQKYLSFLEKVLLIFAVFGLKLCLYLSLKIINEINPNSFSSEEWKPLQILVSGVSWSAVTVCENSVQKYLFGYLYILLVFFLCTHRVRDREKNWGNGRSAEVLIQRFGFKHKIWSKNVCNG